MGTFIFHNGDRYKGHFVNGLRHGEGIKNLKLKVYTNIIMKIIMREIG